MGHDGEPERIIEAKRPAGVRRAAGRPIPAIGPKNSAGIAELEVPQARQASSFNNLPRCFPEVYNWRFRLPGTVLVAGLLR